MRISEHLYFYRAREVMPMFGLSSGNSSIIRGDTLTLVDPGTSPGFHLRHVKNKAESDGLRFSDITQIAISHAHQDHAPAAATASRVLGARVLCHPLDIPLLEEPSRFFRDEYDALRYGKGSVRLPPQPLLDAFVLAVFGKIEPCAGATPVREGFVIDEKAGAYVVELPGHRPGEIGIHIPRDGALVTGDIINRRRYDIPSLNLPFSDLDMTMSSLKKILDMDVSVIASGHERYVKGRLKIRRWVKDVLAWCERARETAARETARDPGISLLRLGKLLIGDNSDFLPYDTVFVANAALKSIGYEADVPMV